ncbi:GNAT family N-acetyltransferase [Oceanirhabdus sp. W0125-5]|uniref:GNAT family N-acetyltransferase n=1 Tax=Oceanirhabdus sp. W0125-5 TaxID=2999116 RepID=UPI0022F2AB5D|nr:GNAT family N-acetyltransferase [Oceanirhabdus sp. W0125-5]WBW98979.1 GNAT family N-acetyltransferase [Oceanirhabdus sp. W0125-5]
MYNNIRLETERLIIRNFAMDDLEAFHKILNTNYIMDVIPFSESRTLEEAKESLSGLINIYNKTGPSNFVWLFLAVVEKTSNEVIGFEAVAKLTYDKNQKELFYGFFKEYWGKGYGSEATDEMLRFIFNDIGFEVDHVACIMSPINPSNNASTKIIEKHGAVKGHVIEETGPEYVGYTGEIYYSIKNNKIS